MNKLFLLMCCIFAQNSIKAMEDREYPLHQAAKKGDLKTIKALLSTRFCLDASTHDEDRATPLHYAAREGNLAVVQELLCCPFTEINAEARSNETPLMWAICGNFLAKHEASRQLLAEHETGGIKGKDHQLIVQELLNTPGIDIYTRAYGYKVDYSALDLALKGECQAIIDMIKNHEKRQILALAMATHLRLGAHSPAQILATDGQSYILRTIFGYLTQQ